MRAEERRTNTTSHGAKIEGARHTARFINPSHQLQIFEGENTNSGLLACLFQAIAAGVLPMKT